jgi:lysozyme family protein
MTLFDKAFDYLMDIEKGYSDDPDDSGGKTKYGISKASFPNEDIENLTKDRAKELYRINYWEQYKCHMIKSPVLAVELFVAVVNINAVKVIKMLQRACNTLGAALEPDGIMGGQTLTFLNCFRHPKAILAAMEGEMYGHYKEGKKKYIAGWLIRNDKDFEDA